MPRARRASVWLPLLALYALHVYIGAREPATPSYAEQTALVASGVDSVVVHAQRQVAPIREALLTFAPDTSPTQEVAAAVERASRATGIPPGLLVATIRVENPWLKPAITSHAGALGIMQVMPSVWEGRFPECGDDLTDVDTNVCYGSRILAYYLAEEWSRAVRRALLRYNGCKSTSCRNYPDLVLASAGGSEREVVWMNQ